ncbi:MAG: response regulator transcription factor [Clostridiaceae bacterium]|nr:response regulator transcription factor [Clostridiaceae bacterium]
MRILIIDDDNLALAYLKTILEAEPAIEVVRSGNSGQQAIELYQRIKPDVLLMDIRMDEMTGIEAADEILAADKEAKILFLTTFSDDAYIAKAFQIGAKGYILKQNFDSIAPSVKAVCMGQRVFGDEIITKLPGLEGNRIKLGISKFNITEKEMEIIVQVANGLSNKEIAKTLFLSEGTVRNYISVILEKLNLRDRTQLAVYYYKHT